MSITTEVKNPLISFRLTSEEKKEARIVAARQDMTINEFAKHLLLEQVKKAEKKS